MPGIALAAVLLAACTHAIWNLYAKRASGSKHFVWPIVGWTTGGGERSWHVWPLVSHWTWEGRYDRWAVVQILSAGLETLR